MTRLRVIEEGIRSLLSVLYIHAHFMFIHMCMCYIHIEYMQYTVCLCVHAQRHGTYTCTPPTNSSVYTHALTNPHVYLSIHMWIHMNPVIYTCTNVHPQLILVHMCAPQFTCDYDCAHKLTYVHMSSQ